MPQHHPLTTTVHPELLQILRCPLTRRRLLPDAEGLASPEAGNPKYAVQQGIPLLIHNAHNLPKQQQRIVRSFSRRADSYFSDNYLSTNSERKARYDLVLEIIEPLLSEDPLVGDVGSGPAVFAEGVNKLGAQYVAVDLSLANLLAARARVPHLHAVVGTVTALPFQSAAFDVALSVGCVEYVEEQRLAIAELLRVTKPEGHVVVSFANAFSPRRWWEETVVRFLRFATRRRPDPYSRRLSRLNTVVEAIKQAGGDVRHVYFIGQGFVGYPLSGLGYFRERSMRRQRSLTMFSKMSAEFVVVAQRVVKKRVVKMP